MPEPTHVIAGRCTTTFQGTRDRTQHGDVLVVVKPDGTVLVHDALGYQPAAWLTRAEAVSVTDDAVTARDGDQFLEVAIHDVHARARYPTSDAGVPVGECPDCEATLVRARGDVTCPGCGNRLSIPADATVLEETCGECGLPRFRVERGASFVVCLDYECESLDERVHAAFDREWDCRECGGDLRVLRKGGLLLGCENYPDCEAGYAFPEGVHDGECACGLPAFETASGRCCLDSRCEGAIESSPLPE